MPEQEQKSITPQFDKESIEEKYHCEIDMKRAEQVLSEAIDAYLNGGEFFQNKKQAEEEYVEFLSEKGESDELVANALFLLSMATFGSKSTTFFNGLGRDSVSYERDRSLLIPSEVVKMKLLKEGDVKKLLEWKKAKVPLSGLLDDLTESETPVLGNSEYEESFNKEWRRYIHPKGRQIQVLEGWYHNCKVLCERYGGSVFGLFEANDDDAVKVLNALIQKPNGKSSKKEFKRFERKLSSLFLQWIGRYNLYPLKNLEEFGLPVDFQLCRIAIQTGIVNILPGPEIRRKDLANNIFLPVVNELCRKNKWEPRLVSESLWLIGSQGCTVDQRKDTPYHTCPIKGECEGVLHKIDNDFLSFSKESVSTKLRSWGSYEKPHF